MRSKSTNMRHSNQLSAEDEKKKLFLKFDMHERIE